MIFSIEYDINIMRIMIMIGIDKIIVEKCLHDVFKIKNKQKSEEENI